MSFSRWKFNAILRPRDFWRRRFTFLAKKTEKMIGTLFRGQDTGNASRNPGCLAMVSILTFTAERLQIEGLEIRIRYNPGTSEKLSDRLGWKTGISPEFAVKTSVRKHIFQPHTVV
jgi:hypothetical protein